MCALRCRQGPEDLISHSVCCCSMSHIFILPHCLCVMCDVEEVAELATRFKGDSQFPPDQM